MFTKLARSMRIEYDNVGATVRLATFRQPLVAIIAIVAITAAGVPLAGFAEDSGSREGSGQQSALDSVLAKIPSDMRVARAGLERRAKSSNQMVAARARKTLTWLNIMEADTPARRRELIRSLPVSIVRSVRADGRGTTVKYVANGKTRFERFEPTNQIQNQNPESSEPSGPMAAISAFAAIVPNDDCYDGPAPCITQGEMDDLGIEIAWLGADLEAAENEYNETCGTYPESCSSPRAAGFVSGPAANECSDEATAAVMAFISGVGAYLGIELGYQGAVASGLRLTTLGAITIYGSIAAVGFVTGFYLGAYLACAWSIEPQAATSGQESLGWSEPRNSFHCAG